jgi:hypothetical protein
MRGEACTVRAAVPCDRPGHRAGGAVVLSGAAAQLDAATVLGMQPAFWAVCALLLGVELRPLFTAGACDPNGHLLTSAFVFALLLSTA